MGNSVLCKSKVPSLRLVFVLLALVFANSVCAQTTVYENGNVKIIQSDDGWEVLHGTNQVAHGSGTLDLTNLPPMFQDFLEYYAKKEVIRQKRSLKKSGGTGIIWGPYLTTQWNQTAPYNNECPKADGQRLVGYNVDGTAHYEYSQNYPVFTGCVTISSAQVLNFYKYCMPFTVTDSSHTEKEQWGVDNIVSPYFLNTNKVGTDITYNYKYSYTPNFDIIRSDNNELAKFIAGIAFAQRAQFGLKRTGTLDMNQISAFKYRFGYECEWYYENGNINSISYNSIVENAIKKGCPVIVSGTSSTGGGGHSFVVDGYNENTNQFHINFGWGASQFDNFYMSLDDEFLKSKNRNYDTKNWFIIPHPKDAHSIFIQPKPQKLHIINLSNNFEEVYDMDLTGNNLESKQRQVVKLIPGEYDFYFEYADGTIIAPYADSPIQLDVPYYGRFVSKPAKLILEQGKELSFVHTANKSEIIINSKDFTGGTLVITPPNKTEYEIGNNFDDTGLEVYVGYSDGAKTIIPKDSYSLSPIDPNTYGEQTVYVTYNNMKASFKITFGASIAQSIDVKPNKTLYTIGEQLKSDDISVRMKYKGGIEEEIFDYSISGFDTYNIGQKHIVVSYKNFSTTYNIDVEETSSEKVYISGMVLDKNGLPIKTAYVTSTETSLYTQTKDINERKVAFVLSYDDNYETYAFTPKYQYLTQLCVNVYYNGNPGNLTLVLFDDSKNIIYSKEIEQKDVIYSYSNNWTIFDIDNLQLSTNKTYFIGLCAETCYYTNDRKDYYAFYKNIDDEMAYKITTSDMPIIQTDENGCYLYPLNQKWTGTLNAILGNTQFNTLTFNNVLNSVSNKNFVENGINQTFDYTPTIGEEFEYNGIYYKVTSENTVEVISNTSLYAGIEYVDIPKTAIHNEIAFYVTSIGTKAFKDCFTLTEVTMPNTITKIGKQAFQSCHILKSVTIPKNVTTIDYYAFLNCTNLKNIDIENGNTKYASEDGVLYNYDKTKLICYPKGKTETSFVVPNTVETIDALAFAFSKIRSVTIPNAVNLIQTSAFNNSRLKSVLINGAANIGETAFSGCFDLESVEINNANAKCSNNSFERTRLTSVKIGNTVKNNPVVFTGETNRDELLSSSYKSGTYYQKLQNVVLTGNRREDIVKVALSQVGYMAGDNSSDLSGDNTSSSGNYSEIIYAYNQNQFKESSQTANNSWCTEFTWWCGYMAGIPENEMPLCAGSQKLIETPWNTYYPWSDIYKGVYEPQPGDLVLFATEDYALNHTGMIKSCTKHNDGSFYIQTIEGNVSRQVVESSLTLNQSGITGRSTNKYVLGIVKPNYRDKSYNITVSSNNDNYGTVEGGGTYWENETAIIKATSNDGYKFVEWDNNKTEERLTFDVTSDITLKATFSPIDYFIDYNLNGGTMTTTYPTTYTIESENITLCNPTKDGYKFLGWTGTDISEPTINVVIKKGSTGNREYTANYEKQQYTITYIVDDEVYNTIEDVTVGSKITPPQNIAKIGYSFKGWQPEIPETMPAHDLTCEAQWGIIKYTITYNLDGGDNSTDNPTEYTVESDDITLKNPTKDGFVFVGWKTTELDKPTKSIIINKGSIGNRKYSAVWNNNISSITITPPTRIMYFQNEDLDLTGAEITVNYDDGTTETVEITAEMITGFNSQILGIQLLTITYNGKSTGFYAYISEPPHYILKGSTSEQSKLSDNGGIWQYKLGINGEYSSEFPKITTAGNYTIYYKLINKEKNYETKEYVYNLKVYQVIYKVHGNDYEKELYSDTYDGLATLPDNPQEYGLEFMGWEYNGQIVPDNYQFTPNQNMVFYANFNNIYHKATFLVDGKEFNSEYYYVKEHLIISSFKQPSKEDELFEGWYYNGQKMTSTFTMPDNDVEIEAHFKPKQYIVTFKVDGNILSEESIKLEFGKEYKLSELYDTTRIVKEGEKFSGWQTDDPDVVIQNDQFTMPDHDVVFNGSIITASPYVPNKTPIRIWSFSKTIYIENATSEIEIIDLFGRSVISRFTPETTRSEIHINNPGIYIVRTGGKTKKVSIQ